MSSPRQTTNKKQTHLSPTTRYVFFALTLAFPILLFIALEIGLRVFNYGPDLSLFEKAAINGNTYCVMNPGVKGRYFSKIQFSPYTSTDFFTIPKPAGTIRIFCLGGSTTVGYPYGYVGAFSTFLRDRLRRIFPEKSFEVINLGMTATNSYTVLDMARDLVRYQPDAFCVYDGHNEFYGALGISSRESIASSRWVNLIYLRLIHYRTFLLLRDLYWLASSIFENHDATEPSGTMMERLAKGQYVRYNSRQYDHALENFRANLEDLKAICIRNGIDLILGSQVSNLRDQPPFVSRDDPGWTPQQKLHFDLVYNRGLAFLLDNKPDSALVTFNAAITLDPMRADVHFERAHCLDLLGRPEAARPEYEKARDYDMLRFRASSDFNNALHSSADGDRVIFADIEKQFRENSPDSLIGNTLILEHLHPNARGQFLIAEEFVRELHSHHLLATAQAWDRNDTISDSPLWEDRAVTALDSLCAARRTAVLTSGWPFTANDRTIPDSQPSDTLGTLAQEMVNGQMTWEEGHVEAARFYARRNETSNVEREYKTLINQIPLNVSGYLLLAQLYLRQGRNQAAANTLIASTKVEQTLFANRALGMLALNPQEGIPYFEKALELCSQNRDRAEVGYLLADAYVRMGKRDQAIAHLQQVLQWSPDFLKAQELLKHINSTQQ